MPLKINVGLSRKLGEPNYSSRGGSVHFEAEVEGTLVREPEELRKRIRYLFRLAEEALAEQLTAATTNVDVALTKGQLERRSVTERQLGLIERLAAQSEISIEALLADVFDTDACEHLSVGEASRLIDIFQAECEPEAPGNNGHA